MKMRKEVRAFAAMMEYKLKKNDHKPNFQNTEIDFLMKRLREEVDELDVAIKSESYFEVMLEAADVANFACIIVWNILRNQVMDSEDNKNAPATPKCDCPAKDNPTDFHHFRCAFRERCRKWCNCTARGELDKPHTVLCRTSNANIGMTEEEKHA